VVLILKTSTRFLLVIFTYIVFIFVSFPLVAQDRESYYNFSDVDYSQARVIPDELNTELKVKAAFNDQYMFFQFNWPAEEGIYHDYLTFQDGKWVAHGGSAYGPREDGFYEDRLSFLVDKGNVKDFETLGCYVTCHEGLRFTSTMATEEEIADVPLLADKADIRKYINETRSSPHWSKIKSEEELSKLRELGIFLDFWHWRAHRSDPIGYSDDQWVLEYRNSDGGKGPYTTNWNSDNEQPAYMFDPDIVGFTALDWDDVSNHRLTQDDYFYISEDIAVEFDPELDWQEGDVIPRRLLRTPDESRATITSNSKWEDGQWSLELKRLLDTGYPEDDIALVPGQNYNIGYAVHKNASGSRWHYISSRKTLGLGIDADVTAIRFDGETPNWDQIEATTIPLYYPGQVSWEFLTSKYHPGQGGILDGTNCLSCHSEEYLGKSSVSHETKDGSYPTFIATTVGGSVLILGIILGPLYFMSRKGGRRNGK